VDITAAQFTPVLAKVLGDALGSAGSQAWDALTRLVKRHWHAPELAVAAEAVSERPDDTALLRALATALEAHGRADAAFGRQVQEWFDTASATVSGQVTNTISGTVQGHAVQARDIHGDITFGSE
jgi:ADP-ribosylglycohydrolase